MSIVRSSPVAALGAACVGPQLGAALAALLGLFALLLVLRTLLVRHR